MVIDDQTHSMAALYNISYNISVCTCVCVRARFLIIKKMIPSLFVHQFQSGDNADSYTHNIYCRFFDQPYDACTRLCIGIYGSHLTSTCVKKHALRLREFNPYLQMNSTSSWYSGLDYVAGCKMAFNAHLKVSPVTRRTETHDISFTLTPFFCH